MQLGAAVDEAGGGVTGAAAEDGSLQQAVGAQAVGAVHAHTGAFTGREKANQG